MFGETQTFIEHLAAARVRMTGTTSGAESYHLVNTAADFSAVKSGWLVVNLSASPIKATYAIKPINTGSGTYKKLLLQDDIFTNSAGGESYEVLRYTSLMLRPPYGLEPLFDTIRWAATPKDVDPTIYGVELWLNDNLKPAALLEKTTRRKVPSGEEKITNEGLITYSIPWKPTYHAALEIRNYSKRAQTIFIGGYNKSIPMTAREQASE